MSEQMGFKTKLMNIQTELKVPKNLFNKFGNYKYRNAEGILEAVKPLLAKYKCVLRVEDDIILVGDRYYVKSTATLIDCESDSEISNVAMAREEAEKKGQDVSQTTGSTSSYARKYCLNGLFLLDDTKDADTDEYHEETTKKAEKQKTTPATDKISDTELLALRQFAERVGVTVEQMKKCVGVDGLEKCTHAQYDTLIKNLKKQEELKAKENK